MVTGSEAELTIDEKNVMGYLGYSADVEPSGRISSLIEEYVKEAYHVIEPSYTCTTRDIEYVDGSNVYIEGSIVFQSEVIARLLERCRKISLFVVTIGNHLGEVANQLAEAGLIVQSYVLDAIGSDAVEKLACFVQELITDKVRAEGLVASRRVSPGCCDLDISHQGILFQAVNAQSIGVHLTEDNLIVPEKSLSGIVGLGSMDSDLANYNPCETCNRANCPWRR